jgi:competence protein ComEC
MDTALYKWIGVIGVTTLMVWVFGVLRVGDELSLYFFAVGQGDSEMVVSDGVRMLIDGGRGDSVLSALERTIPWYYKRIDVLAISHPEQDHMGGLFDVVEYYDVGVVVWNGQENALWEEFSALLNAHHIPVVILGAGDAVTMDNVILSVLWPNALSSETNENSLVFRADTPYGSVLYTGDISSKVEKKLASQENINVDILKIPHHGSKYSSSDMFLRAVSPLLSVVEVGNNSYGHPTQEVLSRLAFVGSTLFRTDIDGTIKLTPSIDGWEIFHIE